MSSPLSREASASPIPGFVSPRSKVAQMLADIDNASSPPSMGVRSSQRTRDPDLESPLRLGKLAHQQQRVNPSSSSEDDSEDDGPRPMGRAARRMMGIQAASRDTIDPSYPATTNLMPSSQDEDDHDALYSTTPRMTRMNDGVPADASDLFVSPAKSDAVASDDDLPSLTLGTQSRFAQLVAQKRAEREAREAVEKAKRQEEPNSTNSSSALHEDDLSGTQDLHEPEIERIMSDAAKPTRKASRKALLEMERETQRIARQQALAHQMKVKKKFTTADLFARFNFRPTSGTVASKPEMENDSSASSAPNSDGVQPLGKEPVSTPPSSPPTPLDRQKALVDHGALSKLVPVRQDSLASLADHDEDNEDLPDIANILSSSRKTTFDDRPSAMSDPSEKRSFILSRLGRQVQSISHEDSSDDELDIIQNMPAHLKAFDKARGTSKGQHQDSRAIHTLKHLSHIGADSMPKRGRVGISRPSIHPQVLEAQLRARAKEQARAQQLERIVELRAKGIEVQTTEECEREAEDFENLLEKARQEAIELRRAEKLAAAGDDPNGAIASDDEDEDYVDGSGSDGEDAETSNVVDDSAEESQNDEDTDSEEVEDDEGGDDEEEGPESLQEDEVEVDVSQTQNSAQAEALERDDLAQTPVMARKSRRIRVIMDDDDEDSTGDAQTAPSLLDDAAADEDEFAAFNFGARPASSLLSPTQAFNATMQTPTQATQQDSFDLLRHLVPPSPSMLPPTFPDPESQSQDPCQNLDDLDTQLPESQRVELAWTTQAPETPIAALRRDGSNLTLDTPGWEPTQDDGLPSVAYQAKHSRLDVDTIESSLDLGTQSTVRIRISESPAPTPKVQPRHRLRRGQRNLAESSDAEEAAVEKALSPRRKDAFREMARKRQEALTVAEREEAERETKKMMDEQAEESEDEYAGLGGDDFVAPETEEDRDMIDYGHIDVDERALAKVYAERQRAAEEAATSKLYKDLTTGALRRKQANMFDLDDDEDDLAIRRRQMRQREEARKRKLLLQDDNIAVLAEGRPSKGKDAFLKAIADDDDRDDELLDLSDDDHEDVIASTQTDSQPVPEAITSLQPLREVSGNKRGREADSEEQLPAKLRRTQASAFRAPTSLLQVKESVSFLLEEPHIIVSETDADEHGAASASEHDQSDEEEDAGRAIQAELDRSNDGGYAPDRVQMPPPRLPASQRRTAAKPTVIDRLILKRGTSAAAAADSGLGRTAWAAPANGGFKTPSLLRRATTNTAVTANERGVSTSNGVARENSGGGMRMGGSKKSSLAYQARAEERRAIVEASARRRAQNTARIAMLRRGTSGELGRGLTGSFE